ncbi:MAG: hypothetical protein ABSF83_01475 [Nitrososphaerales archaeon]|jgi:hypothetical protein
MATQGDLRSLEHTLAAFAVFSAFAVYSSDPSGFGPLFVGAVAYISSLTLLLAGSGFAKRGRLTYLLMVVSVTAAVVLLGYLATAGNGSPEQGSQVSYSCTSVQIPNATSPSGFTSGSQCTGSPYYNGQSVLYNVAFWTPLVGSLVYAMPSWIEPGRRTLAASCSRILRGSVPAGTLLLLAYGLDNGSSGYPELFNGHSPLNPFVSYNPNCDSVTFGVINCVKVNAAYYFIDYAFWIAVVALLALALGALSMLVVNRAGSSGPSPAGRTGTAGSQYAKKGESLGPFGQSRIRGPAPTHDGRFR